MKKIKAALAALVLVAVLVGCDNDRGARKDLPNNSQMLDESVADIYLFPDRYPNLAHKCDETTGMWTTTDRGVWVVYDDILCGGTVGGLVLSNIPGQRQAGDWIEVTNDEEEG